MSPQPLTGKQPAPPAGIEVERLRTFATAMAQRDRSRHRRWLRDADVEGAIRGYAYAAAIAEHRMLTLSGDDIDGAISTYRRVRRLPAQHEPSQRSLIAVMDGAPATPSRAR
jgi:hypothetical protein